MSSNQLSVHLKEEKQSDLSVSLAASFFFDFEKDSLVEYAQSLVGEETNPIEIVKRLYLGVRDDIRYNAYTFEKTPESFSASYCLAQGESYCIPKAVLLGALCRLYKIPARLGLADVRNHMASQQFLDYLKSDVFVMHGYTDIFLDGKWVKATPAFDSGLCKLMNLNPLEFNGREDSIFHEFDKSGAKHMEYLKDHGVFNEVPHLLILKNVIKAYPHLATQSIEELKRHSMYEELNDELSKENSRALMAERLVQ